MMDPLWGTWLFRLLTTSGVERVVVHARCEYDAWVIVSVLRGLQVDLSGLSHD